MSSVWRFFLLTSLTRLALAISSLQDDTSLSLLPRNFEPLDDRPKDCPPCFNCNLEDTPCQQFGNCTTTSGTCSCPPGFGGLDCSQPMCGSLARGDDRQARPPNRRHCACDKGWEGLNCNVCTNDEVCNAFTPDSEGGVCYKGGLVQKENFHMCNITNSKILKQLNPRKPQATFSCNASRKECGFQFWVDGLESFYCGLDSCSWNLNVESNRNSTKYACNNMKCRCVPGRVLCGENGSVDIGQVLTTMTGPASFSTISTEGGSPEDGSTFEEPHMDDLIESVFGDQSITLSCNAGECLHKTEVPGYEKPIKKINTPLIAGVIAGCALFFVALILLVWYLTRRTTRYGPIHLSDNDEDDALLMADHKPTSLHFDQVSYLVNGKQILTKVQGAVHPGQLMAIMGASGAGKTTFLDILARKNKKGAVSGSFYVNGERIPDDEFRNVIGFVDQEDTLLPTLTVHETILDSALLRLPRDMPRATKEQKVEDVEKQLGIYQIRDSVIGAEETRGISGGEKRRVGIACELVTSPSILFLDEPTSGLDAYNAFNVVECLVNLVKTYNRTVVFTIHQPRSNIVALFDQLVLLAHGRTVYSGPFSSCQDYFNSIGYACPAGFNIADYLVDLTMHSDVRSPMDDIIEAQTTGETRSSSIVAVKSVPSKSNIRPTHSSSGSLVTGSSHAPSDGKRSATRQRQDGDIQSRKKRTGAETPTSVAEEEQSIMGTPKDSRSSWLRLSRQTAAPPPPQTLDDPHQLPPDAVPGGSDLDNIITSYKDSELAASVAEDIKEAINNADAASRSEPNGHGGLHSNGSSYRLKGYRKTGVLGQFRILSVRTWRNLYRNPMLMLTHYAIAILLAVFLGFLFYGLTDDIAGFQNRLGLFFFVLALFGFSTLTSLTVFAQERLLFMRERAKGYYRPVSYFSAKVFFDIVPLRLIPPIILGAIVYPMTGLVPQWPEFLKFVAFMILFNFAAAAICLFLGVIFRNGGVANLIGSLTMLFSLLFSGFLLNHKSIPKPVLWLQTLSIFHYGFEGLIVNEVKRLSLTDHKYGLDIEVPGAAILTGFGFDVKALEADFVGLAVVAGAFLLLGYACMHVLLVERR